jgi:hypothetical protein
MSYTKLIHNGTTYTVNNTGVTVGGQTNIFNKPNTNGTEVVEIQTQSFNNPTYVLQGVHFTGKAGTLTYSALLDMYKHRYTGSNPIYLMVSYGAIASSDNTLVASDGVTTSIPVVMTSFNFPINTQDTRDGYMPVGSINFVETK